MKKVESRAFFNVGVLQYKKKRGMQITGSSKMDFLICPLDITAGTKGLFIKNPFICMDNEEYNSAIFEENDKSFSKEDFEQFYKDY